MRPAIRHLPTMPGAARCLPAPPRPVRRPEPAAADEPLRLAEAASLIAGASLALWGLIGALAWSVLG